MFIEVDQEDYEELLEKAFWLSCLEEAGVDNWTGYDYAKEIYEEKNSQDNDVLEEEV